MIKLTNIEKSYRHGLSQTFVLRRVSVNVTPTSIAADDVFTTSVTATGNVAANSSCRKERLIHFVWVTNGTGAETVLAETATTKSNGDFSATVPKPPDARGTYVLRATVDASLIKSSPRASVLTHRTIALNG